MTGSATNGAGYGPFAYLAAPNAPLYRRIMRALLVEKERFTVHARPERVYAVLGAHGDSGVSADAIADALERLADPAGETCSPFPDASRVTALEDFHRRRMLYQMSRQGEAAEGALAQYWPGLRIAGALRDRIGWTPWRYTTDDYVALASGDVLSVDRPSGGFCVGPGARCRDG